jgi:hypothetical protein
MPFRFFVRLFELVLLATVREGRMEVEEEED